MSTTAIYLQLPLCAVDNEIKLEMADNTTQDGTEQVSNVGAEAHAPNINELSDENVPDEDQVAESDDTQSESGDENVAALHELLKQIDEDGDDTGDADNEKLDSMLSGMSPEHVNRKDQHYAGSTALHLAARRGLTRAVKQLIQANADVNAQDNYGDTPLHDACWQVQEGIVSLLLKHDASPNACNNSKWTCLHTATNYGSVEIVDMLLGNGARLNAVDTDNWTPLMLATRNEDENIIKKLLEPRKEHKNHWHALEIKDDEGNTPLMWAVTNEFAAGVDLLICAGADCNTRSSTHTTPIIEASDLGNKEILSLLLNQDKSMGVNIDAQDDEGQTALHHAIWEEHAEVVELLLEAKNKANVWTRDNEGRSALHLAILLGNEIILETVLRLELDTHDNQVTRPFQGTSAPGDVDVNPSLDDDRRHALTPSNIRQPDARPAPYSTVVRILQKRTEKPNIPTRLGRLFLDLAAEINDKELTAYVVQELNLDDGEVPAISISKAVNSDKESGGFRTLLTWAAGYSKRHYAAKLLIKKRFPMPSLGDLEDWGAIEWAAWAGLSKELWLLIASSPRNEGTMRAVEKAKALNVGKEAWGEHGLNDTIEDPPFGFMQVWDRRTFGLPTFDTERLFKSKKKPVMEKQFDFLRNFKAVLIQFYKGQNQFATIRRDRAVRRLIYDQRPRAGPRAVMRQAREEATRYVQDFNDADRGTAKTERPIYMESDPSFTWIHLPSTNVRISDIMAPLRFETDLL